MKKLSIFSLIILLAVTAVNAAPGNYWYGGLVLGATDWQNAKTLSVKMATGDSSGQVLPLKSQSDQQYAGVGGLAFGAMQEGQQFVIAEQIELLYQTVDNQISKKVSTSTFTNTVEETQAPTAVVSLLPGIVFNRNWSMYAKIGYAVSQFESNASNSGVFGPNGNFSEIISGLQTGIGIQRHFPKRWTVRLEYDYTNYGDFTFTGKNDAGIPGGAGGIVSTKYAITTNQVMFDAVYSF